MDQIERYVDGSYSTSDAGGRGDIYALAPHVYPVPKFLAEYFDLAKALRVATSTCALQQGLCWVVRRDRTLPRVGQRCGRGECGWRGPNSPGLAGALAGLADGSLADRLGGTPVALATSLGLAVVVDGGAVLPLWQRIYRNTEANHFVTNAPGETYQAAVRAAMVLADRSRKQRLVYAWGKTGNPIPMVYVHPGGLVTSARKKTGNATRVDLMDNFELRQAIAASSGASIMPHGM